VLNSSYLLALTFTFTLPLFVTVNVRPFLFDDKKVI